MSSLILQDQYQGGYDLGNLKRAEVREGFGAHQIAILDYFVPRTGQPIPPSMTPVSFSWGFTPDVRDFYGYVNHHEVMDSAVTGESVWRTYCIGTSQSLNDPEPRSWKNVTASYVARTVAEKHGLRVLVHNSKTILPYVSPGQKSDWALLKGLANDAGFEFWVDGATVYFLDPNILVTSPDRAVASEYDFDQSSTDTLLRIRNLDGSMLPIDSAPAIQKVYGLNDDSGLIQASSARDSADLGLDAPVNTKVYPKSVSSVAEAHRVSNLAASAGNWSTLQAITKGDGKTRVGSLVILDGTAMQPDYTGVWMTSSIYHVLSASPQAKRWVYTTQMELTRNQKNQSFFRSFSTLKDSLSQVDAVLRNGRWEASLLEAVYV